MKNKLRICGKDFSVTEIVGLGDFGVTNFDENSILLKAGMNKDNKISTLCHEIIEIWNEAGDLNLNHQTIQTIESYMFQTFKDNKLW